MKKIKKFIFKYWLFILLATIATIFATIFFINKKTEETQEQLLSLGSPEIETVSISFSPNIKDFQKNFPAFEKKINVYEVGISSISDQQAIKIALDFGFTEKPNVTNFIYSWATEFNNLSIYLKEGIVGYGLNLLTHPELISGSPPLIKEVEIQGEEFLNKRGFLIPKKINLQVEEKYYVKVVGSYFMPSKQEDKETTLTYIKFIYKLNGKKIKGPGLNYISFYIGSDFKTARFDYNKIFEEIKTGDAYPLKSKEEVISSLQANPKISYLKRQDKYSDEYLILIEAVENLRSLSFENIELIYYKYSPLQTYLQPVFLITGTAQLKDGEAVEAGLYLPAIKDEYLLTP